MVRVGFDELFDVDGLAYLDELLNAFVFRCNHWEEMSAIAEAHGGMQQCAAIRALLHWCHAVAWLLRVVEDIAPVSRR